VETVKIPGLEKPERGDSFPRIWSNQSITWEDGVKARKNREKKEKERKKKRKKKKKKKKKKKVLFFLDFWILPRNTASRLKGNCCS